MLQLMVPPNPPQEISALTLKRLSLPGKPSQGEIANRISDLIGEVIGQQAISYWEKGRVDLRNVHPRRLRAYAKVLGVSERELAELAGYQWGDLFFADKIIPLPPVDIEPDPRPLPDGLQAAIDVYGRRFSDLLDPAWQQYMAKFRWRTGQPEDAEAWLDLYRDLSRAGIVPGEN